MPSLQEPGGSTDSRIKEALLYKKLAEGRVRCGTCERFCEIAPDRFGFCKTRMNMNSTLYTVVYGDISSLSVNPIEKKPFFHFYPAGTTVTFSTFKVLAVSHVMGATFLNVIDFFTLLTSFLHNRAACPTPKKSGEIPLHCRNG